ncbi:MAG TPA: hypothetical protein PKJ98_04605 [Verrucomicrobiota bacterium]|nr:hypothetical protein [Verrucomicrobiota bacterium]
MSKGRQPRLPKTDRGPRFCQLFALALEENTEAVADLWREFGFRYGEDQP